MYKKNVQHHAESNFLLEDSISFWQRKKKRKKIRVRNEDVTAS